MEATGKGLKMSTTRESFNKCTLPPHTFSAFNAFYALIDNYTLNAINALNAINTYSVVSGTYYIYWTLPKGRGLQNVFLPI